MQQKGRPENDFEHQVLESGVGFTERDAAPHAIRSVQPLPATASCLDCRDATVGQAGQGLAAVAEAGPASVPTPPTCRNRYPDPCFRVQDP